jgi:epoxyqueuosine reductase
MGRHVFGCDICQEVCPWNRRSPVTVERQFEPRTFAWPGRNGEQTLSEAKEAADGNGKLPMRTTTEQSLLLPRLEWLAALTEEEYRIMLRGSPMKRTKWRGLVRNACIALGNSTVDAGSPAYLRLAQLLRRLGTSRDEVIAESAQWALSRIQ